MLTSSVQIFVLVNIAFWPLCSLAQAIDTPDKPQGQVSSSKSSTVTMTECEGVNDCATWTFLDSQGNGKWPSKSEANLTVVHSDSDSVEIKRADSTGKTAGYTAVYKGKRHGGSIGGEFTYSWNGQQGSGNWYAKLETDTQGVPRVMWHCMVDHKTLQWTWNGNHYDASNAETGEPLLGFTLTVTSFTHQSVILRRTQPGAIADFRGKVSSEGNSIEGDSTWHAGDNTWDAPFKMFWGTAKPKDCNAPPQAQQSRSVVVVQPVLACFPWFFGVICD